MYYLHGPHLLFLHAGGSITSAVATYHSSLLVDIPVRGIEIMRTRFEVTMIVNDGRVFANHSGPFLMNPSTRQPRHTFVTNRIAES
jgi:hypothetical protein